MMSQSPERLSKSTFLMLPVIALAFFIAFIPNLNYDYAVHIDEWVHIAHNEALLRAASIDYPDPFSGQGSAGLVGILEAGFHTLFGVFYKISGISWIDITRYMPGFLFIFTALAAYVLARREGFGWEAAFFTCLIPTTVGIMGPAFFIPMAVCLPFVLLVLFLVFYYRTLWAYLLIAVLTGFIIITHATSAVCLILILVPCVLLYLIREPKHGIILLLIGIVPFLVTLPWTYDLIMSTAKSLFVVKPLPANHDLPRLLKTYGYIPFGVGLLGTFWLAIKGGVKNYSLVLGLLVLLAMLAVFYTLHYGVDLVYLRGIIYSLLIFGIVAGAGLMAIKNIKLPDKLPVPGYFRRIGYLLCLVLVAVILAIAIPARQNTPYYHMIDNDDYETFVWINENIDDSYQRAILKPWKGTPFTAITGKYVYARIHMGPDKITQIAEDFLKDGCSDTSFLRENEISIVYTREECSNPDLVEVRKWVYLLKER